MASQGRLKEAISLKLSSQLPEVRNWRMVACCLTRRRPEARPISGLLTLHRSISLFNSRDVFACCSLAVESSACLDKVGLAKIVRPYARPWAALSSTPLSVCTQRPSAWTRVLACPLLPFPAIPAHPTPPGRATPPTASPTPGRPPGHHTPQHTVSPRPGPGQPRAGTI